MADGDNTDSGQQLQLLISTLAGVMQAVNGLNTTLKAVFPQGSTIAATAGASASKYLVVQGTDGSTYKIALLLP